MGDMTHTIDTTFQALADSGESITLCHRLRLPSFWCPGEMHLYKTVSGQTVVYEGGDKFRIQDTGQVLKSDYRP